MKGEKDIKMCKKKKKKPKKISGRKSAEVSILLFFLKGGDEKENVASVGPPHMTAEDVDHTTLGVVNCAPALTQAQEGVGSTGRLVASCKVGSKGQLGFRGMKKKGTM